MDTGREAELIEACRRGERAAFNVLVRQHQERLYWAIRRFVDDPDDAYDIAQDVFVRAWQSIAGFRGDSRVFTWLYRIAVNLSLNHLRRKKLRAFIRLEERHDHLYSISADSGASLEEERVNSLIEKAIQRLPEKQRMVFVMRYYDEIPYEEMARMLGKSTGGLKANYHHAVKKVQEYVKHAMQ